MNNYTIELIHIMNSIDDTNSLGLSRGFLFKYLKETKVISVHHFKSIIATLMITNSIKTDTIKTESIKTTEKVLLRVDKNVYWNELMIFNNPDKKYTLNTKVIKSYRTKFVKKGTPVNMIINNKKNTFVSEFYDIIQSSQWQKNYYLHFLISDVKDNFNELKYNFSGLSGMPVFDNERHLIGIFCKIKSIDDKLYGLVLPVIYLIKTLDKEDNENLYYLNIDILNIDKIGKYKIKQYLPNTEYKIYYLPIKYEIPLDIYYSLEGNVNNTIKCKEKNDSITLFNYEKYENYDISNKIIKKDNKFKLNTGLLTYLVSNKMESEYIMILNNYIKKCNYLQDIWISFDNICEESSTSTASNNC